MHLGRSEHREVWTRRARGPGTRPGVRGSAADVRGRIGRLLLLLLLLGACVLGVRPAHAEQEDALGAIRTRMEEGQGLFLAGKYQEAARAFEAGYASHPYSAFLFNAGVCHQKSNDPEAAQRAFEAYLAKDPTAPDAGEVKKRLAELAVVIAARKA